MNHARPHAQATADLRDHEALGLDRPAERGVRRPRPHRRRPPDRGPAPPGTGRYNIPNVGLFLWRTEAVPLARSPLVEHADGRRFRFDPLGADAPLFGLPRTETEIAHLAEPLDVPLPLGRRWPGDHLDAYYGRGPHPPARAAGGRRGPGAVCRATSGSATSPTSRAAAAPGRTSRRRARSRSTPCSGRVFLGDARARRRAAARHVCLRPGRAGRRRRLAPVAPSSTPEPRRGRAGGEDLQPQLDRGGGGRHGRDRRQRPLRERSPSPPRRPPAGQPETEVRLVAAAGARPSLVLATR